MASAFEEEPMKHPQTHSQPRQVEMRACACCVELFPISLPWQKFCGGPCRNRYNRLHGLSGRIVVNRKLMRGRTSIVLRFDGPDADTALKLGIGDVVMIAKEPGR
jgi:hypothetical protein